MDKDKLSLYYIRLKDKTLNISLRPVVAAAMSKGVKVHKVVYGEPKSKLTASELFTDKSAKKPVLIYIHGGGWVQGSNTIRNPYCSRIADLGFYVLNINYELAPDAPHPAQVRNIFRAVSYVFEKKDEYNLDTDSIFFGGDSAGAHLAALAAGVTVNQRLYDGFEIDFAQKDVFKVKGLIMICGVFEFVSCRHSDFPNMFLYLKAYSGYDVRELENENGFLERQDIKDMCPVTLVNPEYPPCIVLSGEKDPLRFSSDVFCDTLQNNGVKTAAFRGTGRYSLHCFPLYDGNENGKKAMKEVYAFLHEILGENYGLNKIGAAPVDSNEIGGSVLKQSSGTYDGNESAEQTEKDGGILNQPSGASGGENTAERTKKADANKAELNRRSRIDTKAQSEEQAEIAADIYE
ncbi:MAG: alpha/beta hydrolase [Clostridiales bacterium]|jgi:acetyl esterase/lipase|nr:alpha/beta hydrolase [Clostridiales bacterium]